MDGHYGRRLTIAATHASRPYNEEFTETPMPLTCVRCGKTGEAPPAHRVPFTPEAKAKVLESVCSTCWTEWEDMEVKVINEYRLNFLDPEHRAMLQRACLEFLNVQA
jgi:Fe-S cluster biosynthesis and repair protein YggX